MEQPLFDTCRWARCENAPRPGAALCEDHILKIVHEPLGNFERFLKELPFELSAKVAENALYHAINTAVHVGMFPSRDGHDLMRTANFARSGRATLDTVIDKILMTVIPRDRGEFMMHLKRHLLVPERRSVRREAAL